MTYGGQGVQNLSHKPHQIEVSSPIMVATWLLISRTKSHQRSGPAPVTSFSDPAPKKLLSLKSKT